jgi:hypothetical protein
MQPDPQRLADTESWLRKAANDLRYAGIDLAADPPATEDAVFHCQQADATLEALIDRVVDLSKYAWMFRNPGDPVEPTGEEAQEILGRAKSVVDEIRTRIA